MKLPHLFTLTAVLLLSACFTPKKVDPTTGPLTGSPRVMGRHGEAAETQIMTDSVLALAAQYPHRPAFETAVMQKIRLGELKATKLTVLYEDGTARVFK